MADGRDACTTSATYSLFLIFGIGAWLTVNGFFSELPLLVVTAPEGWRLGSVLALVVQLANIGPLMYYVAQRWARTPGDSSESKQTLLATRATYGVLLLGMAAMVALAFFWSVTVTINGTENSVPLLIFAFLAAFADCTSSLLFWHFSASFRPVHLSALTAGEGLSGVVASGLAWVQDAAGKEPRFSPATFFLFLAVAMFASAAAFHMLRCSSFARIERVQNAAVATNTFTANCISLQPQEQRGGSYSDKVPATDVPATGLLNSGGEHSFRSFGLVAPSPRSLGPNVIGMFVLQAWLNVLQNGVSVSCLALAAKPYGRETYQIAWTAAMFIDPLAAAFGYKVKVGALALVPVALTLGALYGYILALSFKSVIPPLLGAGGDSLLIGVVIVGRALTSYAKMRANVLIQGSDDKDAPDRLMWSGIAMQCGALIGSVTMYLLINFTDLFRDGH